MNDAEWREAWALFRDLCDAGAIQREAQQIDFPLPTSAQVGGTLPTPTATSGGPVSLTAEPSHICEVFNDVVHYRAAGSCTVEATQSGTALFRAAAPVTRTFDITAAPKTYVLRAVHSNWSSPVPSV